MESYPIEVVDDIVSQSAGEYHILDTATGLALPFSGSGVIATLTFRVTNPGSTGLVLASELSDHPADGGTANLIVHTDTADSVTSVGSGPSTLTTPTPTSSSESSTTPQPSTSVSEFSNIALITILIIVLSAIGTISTKKLKNRSRLSTQNATNL